MLEKSYASWVNISKEAVVVSLSLLPQGVENQKVSLKLWKKQKPCYNTVKSKFL